VARNQIVVHAPPEEVFRVLEDPRCYGAWVVGSSDIRAADPDWPAPGTAFDHTVGTWPLKLADSTEVLAADPPRFLQLLAHAKPLPPARVTLRLEPVPERAGTRVVMEEDIAPALVRYAVWLPTQLAIRLKALAEGTMPWPGGALPPRAA
jgi:hypothetical protein